MGSYGRKQIATDLTGAVTEDGQWLYRLVAVGRESGTQVDHVNDDRLVIAPSLTWRPSADTSLTLQALYQKDKSGSLIGFFPWQGTRLPSPYGQIPTSTFIGEPGWDSFDTENKSWGYLFSHRLNADWTVRQNLRRTISDVDYRSIYTSFTAIPGQGRPARPVFNPDNRSVYRDASWQVNGGRMLVIDTQLEGRLRWGTAEHTVLAGMDAQRNSTSQSTWRGLTAPFDVYNPVYGNFTPPTASQLVRQPACRKSNWASTPRTRSSGAAGPPPWACATTAPRPIPKAGPPPPWTRRPGPARRRHLPDGWWLGALPGLLESFQPLGGVDVYGTPYKAQRGEQWEAGVKWQPPGQGLSAFAAVYTLREKNRKTTDPANPLNSLQIGEVKVNGFEAELTASLARHWDATLAYAYTDAVISRSNGGDQGQRVTSVPRHTASAWLTHRFASEGRGGWSLGAGVRYTGSQWTGTSLVDTPSATLLDAMVSYDAGPWRLAFNVVNLTDKVQITQCLARGDCFYGQRRAAVTGTHRF